MRRAAVRETYSSACASSTTSVNHARPSARPSSVEGISPKRSERIAGDIHSGVSAVACTKAWPSLSRTRKRVPAERSSSSTQRRSSRRSAMRSMSMPAKTFSRARVATALSRSCSTLTPGNRSCAERGAATARGLRVGIANDELRAAERFGVVDLGAGEVLQRKRIHHQGHAFTRHGKIVFGLFLVEREAILEARTTAAADIHAQLEAGIAFLFDQFVHLAGGGFSEDERRAARPIVRCRTRGHGEWVVHTAHNGAVPCQVKPRSGPGRTRSRPGPAAGWWVGPGGSSSRPPGHPRPFPVLGPGRRRRSGPAEPFPAAPPRRYRR